MKESHYEPISNGIKLRPGLNYRDGFSIDELRARTEAHLDLIRLGSDQFSWLDPRSPDIKLVITGDSEGEVAVSVPRPARMQMDLPIEDPPSEAERLTGLPPAGGTQSRPAFRGVSEFIQANQETYDEIGRQLPRGLEGEHRIRQIGKERGINPNVAIRHHQHSRQPVSCETDGREFQFVPKRAPNRFLLGTKSVIDVRFEERRVLNVLVYGVVYKVHDSSDDKSRVRTRQRQKFQLPNLHGVHRAIVLFLIAAGYKFHVNAFDTLHTSKLGPGASDVDFLESPVHLAEIVLEQVSEFIRQAQGAS